MKKLLLCCLLSQCSFAQKGQLETSGGVMSDFTIYKNNVYVDSINVGTGSYSLTELDTGIYKLVQHPYQSTDQHTIFFTIYSNEVTYLDLYEKNRSYSENIDVNIANKGITRDGFELVIHGANRNWGVNKQNNISHVDLKINNCMANNLSAYTSIGATFGGQYIVALASGDNKLETITSLSNKNTQNLHQLNFSTTVFFRLQIPYPVRIVDENDLMAWQFGVGYNLPIINRYSIKYSLGTLQRERLFHTFSDAFAVSSFQIDKVGIHAEWHPFSMFTRNIPELATFRIGLVYQILD
jgi:hypothetical protein